MIAKFERTPPAESLLIDEYSPTVALDFGKAWTKLGRSGATDTIFTATAVIPVGGSPFRPAI